MKTAMRAAYEVVQKQVRDAERQKGVRRGARSMFDRQMRQQEAQARGQALGAGVSGNDEAGGSQGSSQGHRLGGHIGVHRSIQEEWDTEEENKGDGEVLGDRGAITRKGKPTRLGSTGEGEAAGGVGSDTEVLSDSFSEGDPAGRGDGERGQTKGLAREEGRRGWAQLEAENGEDFKGWKRLRRRRGGTETGKRPKGAGPPGRPELPSLPSHSLPAPRAFLTPVGEYRSATPGSLLPRGRSSKKAGHMPPIPLALDSSFCTVCAAFPAPLFGMPNMTSSCL